MTHDKELELAAERYATGNHRSSFADTSDAKAFTAGAEFQKSRAEMLETKIKLLELQRDNLVDSIAQTYHSDSSKKEIKEWKSRSIETLDKFIKDSIERMSR